MVIFLDILTKTSGNTTQNIQKSVYVIYIVEYVLHYRCKVLLLFGLVEFWLNSDMVDRTGGLRDFIRKG